MILADKIIMLRKKQGWSQEELAQKLDVTRQSVSKWESAQSVPDICKIVQLSELFGVTTDYLLKDEELTETKENDAKSEYTEETSTDANIGVRKISANEAEEYISIHKANRSKIALASLLCVISPIFLLGIIVYLPFLHISELFKGMFTIFGIIFILIFVGIAVSIFIICGSKTKKFEYMEKDFISLVEEARKLVEAEKLVFSPTYTKYNIIGTLCCIFSVIPLLIGSFYSEPVVILCLCCLLICVGIGVYFFVSAGVLWGSFQRLLEEGEYSRKAKASNKSLEPIAGIYWLAVTAVFLGYSFATGKWGESWIIWPVAGVAFGIIAIIVECIGKKK